MNKQSAQTDDYEAPPGEGLSMEPFKSSSVREVDPSDLDQIPPDMAEIKDAIENLLAKVDENEAPMVHYLLRYALIEARSVGLQV